jgi:hypothetical protein
LLAEEFKQEVKIDWKCSRTVTHPHRSI